MFEKISLRLMKTALLICSGILYFSTANKIADEIIHLPSIYSQLVSMSFALPMLAAIIILLMSIGIEIIPISIYLRTELGANKIFSALLDLFQKTEADTLLIKKIERLEDNLQKHVNAEKQKAVALVYAKEKSNKLEILLFSILFTILVFFRFEIWRTIDKTNLIVTIIVMSICFVALCIDRVILEYRINSGFFGTNEYEAKKLLLFIIQNSNNWEPPNDGDRNRKIFPEKTSSDNFSINEGLSGEGIA